MRVNAEAAGLVEQRKATEQLVVPVDDRDVEQVDDIQRLAHFRNDHRFVVRVVAQVGGVRAHHLSGNALTLGEVEIDGNQLSAAIVLVEYHASVVGQAGCSAAGTGGAHGGGDELAQDARHIEVGVDLLRGPRDQA